MERGPVSRAAELIIGALVEQREPVTTPPAAPKGGHLVDGIDRRQPPPLAHFIWDHRPAISTKGNESTAVVLVLLPELSLHPDRDRPCGTDRDLVANFPFRCPRAGELAKVIDQVPPER